jgi:hypothetical protein
MGGFGSDVMAAQRRRRGPLHMSLSRASLRVRGCSGGNGAPERPISARRNFLWRSVLIRRTRPILSLN